MRPRLMTLTLVAALWLIGAAPAAADFQTLYDDYRSDSVIDGCSYSSAELGAALSDTPADIRQYDPGYAIAINQALEQSAAGCDLAPAEIETPNLVTAADGSPGPAADEVTKLRTAGAGRDFPLALAALIAALAALLLAGGGLAAARRGDSEPAPPPPSPPEARGF